MFEKVAGVAVLQQQLQAPQKPMPRPAPLSRAPASAYLSSAVVPPHDPGHRAWAGSWSLRRSSWVLRPRSALLRCCSSLVQLLPQLLKLHLLASTGRCC
jgi:hypothetical protein